MLIDKTAIIHKDTEIGEGVSIGEYSVIHSGTIIKDNVKIGSHCSIGTDPEIINNDFKSKLVIKEHTLINNFVSINLGTKKNTEIGKECYIMSHTFIAHDCSVGEKSVITSGVRVLGNVTIGREVYLGANSVVHQNCTVGDLSLLGANSLAKDILKSGIIYTGNPSAPKKINQIGFERSKLDENLKDKIKQRAEEFLRSL